MNDKKARPGAIQPGQANEKNYLNQNYNATAAESQAPSQTSKSDKSKGRPPKPALTREEIMANLDANGITVKWNQITHKLEFHGIPESMNLNPENIANDFPVLFHDVLKRNYTGNLQSVCNLLTVIGGTFRYNPVLDAIKAEPWDGHDYISDLLQIMGIVNDDFSCVLTIKWLEQSIALLNNNTARRYSADGVLVLQGGQGIGKTSLVVALGMRPEWTLTGGYLDSHDKDTLIRSTSYFMVEFGELDATISRADTARLKSFITQENDVFRKPYAQGDTESVRRTSFIGTVNAERFLVDPTGSRRFWVVPVNKIDLAALRRFNALQLWRQVYRNWKQMDEKGLGGECYRLDAKERATLEARNTQHKKSVAAELEIADILSEAETDPKSFVWEYRTTTDFKLENPTLTRYTLTKINDALDALGVQEQRVRIKKDGNPVKRRYLPRRRNLG